MDEKGISMDDSVKSELKQIEGRLELALQKSIQTSIKEGFKEIKEHIAELFNKDIEHINEHLSRHDTYHKEHYSSEKKIWKAIDGLRLDSAIDFDARLKPVIDDLESIKEKQLEITISNETADKIEDKNERKKELSYGKIGAIISIASIVSGGLVYLINYLS